MIWRNTVNPHANQDPSTDPLDDQAQETKHPRKNRWLLPLLLILLVVAVGVFFLIDSETEEEVEPVGPLPLRAIGPEEAPVTITEFADFGCITCQAWHQFGIREQVIEAYGDQVRFVWRDFPVTTPQSPRAAEAGFCAHEQGEFWAYHDHLYANAPQFSDQALKSYAVEIGLDGQRFNACLDSGEFEEAVELERFSALQLGLRSVPSFMVNEQRLIGPPSFEQLAAIIDETLTGLE
jgi:protein-disulfide isomerase